MPPSEQLRLDVGLLTPFEDLGRDVPLPPEIVVQQWKRPPGADGPSNGAVPLHERFPVSLAGDSEGCSSSSPGRQGMVSAGRRLQAVWTQEAFYARLDMMR